MKKRNYKAGRNSRVMTLAMVMLACATISYGQIVQQKSPLLNTIKEKILHRGAHENLFRTVSYYEKSESISETKISRTFHVNSLDVIYDDQLTVEKWMTAPFDIAYGEAIKVEDWMTAPFEGTYEEPVEIETWMTAPFETNDEAESEVEDWMTRPFESALEGDLAVEDWMTRPFNIAGEEVLAVEEWMTQPFELSDPLNDEPDVRMITYLALAL